MGDPIANDAQVIQELAVHQQQSEVVPAGTSSSRDFGAARGTTAMMSLSILRGRGPGLCQQGDTGVGWVTLAMGPLGPRWRRRRSR